MLHQPMDILDLHPIRKTKKQKQAFRRDILEYAESLEYAAAEEGEKRGATNVVIGNPKTAKYLVTAHYDTPASIGIPNILTPCNLVTYLLWQLLLVGGLLTVSGGISLAVIRVTANDGLGLMVWYVIYFGILFLMLFGPANKSNVNDNSSGVITLLEIARTMPQQHRDNVCFVLFDLEEAGLVGSAAYRKTHKDETENQIILNLDCVGDGDEIVLFPTKKLSKDKNKLRRICSIVSRNGNKTISVCNKGFRTYPSDQKNFPFGVGIAAFRRKKGVGLYVSRIHTAKDTVLEETNVNILRAALTTLICQ